MTPFLDLIFILAIILLVAKVSGYLSNKLGQPTVLGELLAGVILGPSLINLVHLPFLSSAHLDTTVTELGEFGVLLLMFLAGLELHLSDLAKNTRVSAYAGVSGVLLPVFFGWVVGEIYGLHMNEALFLGLTLGATSVSISAQTLMELGVLRSRVGLGLLGAAVFDDVLVILLLSIVTATVQGGGGGAAAILLVFVRMVVFLALSAAFGLWVLPRMVRRVNRTSISQGNLTLALVLLMVYGLAAEMLGNMAAITGAFIAGLMFGRSPVRDEIERGLGALAYAFFVPIFFVSIGLGINIRELDASIIGMTLFIILVAILGKLVGAGLGARAAGYSNLESLQLGAGMVSRGEVGLIVAQVGVNEGLLTSQLFSAIVAMVLATTLITPPMLRALFSKLKTQAVAAERQRSESE